MKESIQQNSPANKDKNELGHIFKQYNIVEFKSPKKLGKEHIWFKVLTRDVKREYLEQLNKDTSKLKDNSELLNAESIYKTSYSANRNIPWIKEVITMNIMKEYFGTDLHTLTAEKVELQKQIKDQDETIKDQGETITKLAAEVEKLKKQLSGKVATF